MKITFKKDYIIDVTEDYSPMRKDIFSKTKKVELEGRELSQAIDVKVKKLKLGNGRRPILTKKERTVTQTFDYKKLFNKGDTFELKKGVNIIVGDNGVGKSTLIRLLIENNKTSLQNKEVLLVDMEKINPAVSKPDPQKGITYSAPEILNQFMWVAESHGETREGVLKSIISLDFDLLILDEPEQGLSLKNQKKYLNELVSLKKDIIIITHSKVFIENIDLIFDIEIMEWIQSKDYLENI